MKFHDTAGTDACVVFSPNTVPVLALRRAIPYLARLGPILPTSHDKLTSDISCNFKRALRAHSTVSFEESGKQENVVTMKTKVVHLAR